MNELELIFRPEKYFNAKTLAGLYHHSRLVFLEDVAKNQEGLVGIVSDPKSVGNLRRQTITVKWPYQNNPLLSNPMKYECWLQGIDIGFIEEQRTFGNIFHEFTSQVYDKRHEAIACISDIGIVNTKKMSSTKSVYPLYDAEGWKKLEQYLRDQINEKAALIVPAF